MTQANIVVTNIDAFRKLQRTIIEIQRSRDEAIAYQANAAKLELLIPEQAKEAGLSAEGLALIRSAAKAEAEAFTTKRRLAAQKAATTRKARLPGATGDTAALKAQGIQSIKTATGLVVALAQPAAPVAAPPMSTIVAEARPTGETAVSVIKPATPVEAPQQSALIDVEAEKATKGKKGDGRTKAAYQSTLSLDEATDILNRLLEVGAKAPKRKARRSKK